jgi:hypothetical protein
VDCGGQEPAVWCRESCELRLSSLLAITPRGGGQGKRQTRVFGWECAHMVGIDGHKGSKRRRSGWFLVGGLDDDDSFSKQARQRGRREREMGRDSVVFLSPQIWALVVVAGSLYLPIPCSPFPLPLLAYLPLHPHHGNGFWLGGLGGML